MDSLGELPTFLGQVGKKWWAFVGALSTLEIFLFLVPLDFPLSLLRHLIWFLLCFLLVVAGFDVWRREHHRVQELVSEDANIKLEPLADPGLIQFELPRSYQLFPNVVPPEIWLKVSFLLSNLGGKTGTMDKLDIDQPDWDEQPDIAFRPDRLYAHHREDRWTHRPLDMPIILQRDETRKVTYLLKAGIKEENPQTFAQQFGRLTDFPLRFVWAFHGMAEHTENEATVMVKFDTLRKDVFSTWKTEGWENLIEFADRERLLHNRL